MISREIPISEHQDDVAAGKGAEEIAASSEAHVSGEGIDHDAVIEMLEARV